MPEILTERLVLRAFSHGDAVDVTRLAGERRIADTTATIPHPYPPNAAQAWIATHDGSWQLGRGLTLAITLQNTRELIGAIGLGIAPEHRSAELGYWIGVAYWGNGYATEAARAMIDYGFLKLRLNRIHAHHFARNVASGRVLEKAGMSAEGLQRMAFRKWDRWEDLRLLAILRPDWEAQRKTDR